VPDTDATELEPHEKADPLFYCYELVVGSVLQRRSRQGDIRVFKVHGFVKIPRSNRMASYNKVVHPDDVIVLQEQSFVKNEYKVLGKTIEGSVRWGLVRTPRKASRRKKA
jgi:hypothetical protein